MKSEDGIQETEGSVNRRFEIFAEVGVVLLMFSIGVEFSIPELMLVKRVAILGGPIGILLMLGAAIAWGKLVGWLPN
jgi:CPA2 family monovalent cation:H+ antiporter-2